MMDHLNRIYAEGLERVYISGELVITLPVTFAVSNGNRVVCVPCVVYGDEWFVDSDSGFEV